MAADAVLGIAPLAFLWPPVRDCIASIIIHEVKGILSAPGMDEPPHVGFLEKIALFIKFFPVVGILASAKVIRLYLMVIMLPPGPLGLGDQGRQRKFQVQPTNLILDVAPRLGLLVYVVVIRHHVCVDIVAVIPDTLAQVTEAVAVSQAWPIPIFADARRYVVSIYFDRNAASLDTNESRILPRQSPTGSFPKSTEWMI